MKQHEFLAGKLLTEKEQVAAHAEKLKRSLKVNSFKLYAEGKFASRHPGKEGHKY